MDPIEGLPETIENILIGTLTPGLPELRVRQIVLDDPPGKTIYLVWHPESWAAPHMIHAYGEHRYYKRGNFRAVPMEEGEVERLYARRQSRRALATQFLDGTDFGESLFGGGIPLIRIVVCPAFPFQDRWDFTREAVRKWLKTAALYGGSGWRPFSLGVRFYSELGEGEHWSEERLYRNGAVSRCVAALDRDATPVLRGPMLLKRLDETLEFAGRVFGKMGMTGDLFVDIKVSSLEGVRFDPGESSIAHLIDLDVENRPVWAEGMASLRLPVGATDFLPKQSRWALEKVIMDRLTQCFGIWSVPYYFRKDGSPILPRAQR